MPVFIYEAMDNRGKEVRAEVDATSSEDAVNKIRSKGFFPTKVAPKGGRAAAQAAAAGRTGTAKKGMVLFQGRVRAKHLTTFTRQFSTLQDAGLPIVRSLDILAKQQKAGPLRTALEGIRDDVEGGSSLSEAMSKFPRVFDRLYVNMIKAGEAGGVLGLIPRASPISARRARRSRRRS